MLTCGNDYVSSSCGAGIRSVRSLGSARCLLQTANELIRGAESWKHGAAALI